jgi:hypothetical protein
MLRDVSSAMDHSFSGIRCGNRRERWIGTAMHLEIASRLEDLFRPTAAALLNRAPPAYRAGAPLRRSPENLDRLTSN